MLHTLTPESAINEKSIIKTAVPVEVYASFLTLTVESLTLDKYFFPAAADRADGSLEHYARGSATFLALRWPQANAKAKDR